MQELINRVIGFAKDSLSQDTSGHDWHHTQRVYKLAVKIAKEEKEVDVVVVKIASLLHDVMDHKLGFNDTDREGMVKKCLFESGLTEEQINHIIYIINNMSFKGGKNKHILTSIEGKIVQDADRLDALGAIGVARTFAYGGHAGRSMYSPECNSENLGEDSISHFYEKLLKLKDLIHTGAGKQLAVKRHEFMLNFLQEFYEEWGENL
jgi:uncharacterized protein